jgi:AraC-like DNA-binding protein
MSPMLIAALCVLLFLSPALPAQDRGEPYRGQITFVSRGRPLDAAREAYGNARILTGQRFCSILVGEAGIAQTCIERRSAADSVKHAKSASRTPSGLGDVWDFVTALRALIRPYLAQGHPRLSQVAEIVGMSERTLQRRLAQSRTTYSAIVQEARFLIASDLMADSDLNIADIAFAAGLRERAAFLQGVQAADRHDASRLPLRSGLKRRRRV